MRERTREQETAREREREKTLKVNLTTENTLTIQFFPSCYFSISLSVLISPFLELVFILSFSRYRHRHRQTTGLWTTNSR